MRPVTFKGSSRTCIVPPGDVQALITRLVRLAIASEPLENADVAATWLEGLLGGSPKWRTTKLEEPTAKAIVHVLDMMLTEGSLSAPLYCVRSTLRADYQID